MSNIAKTLMHQVSEIILSSAFLDFARIDPRHFTRNRSLTFTSCICLILTRLTSTLRTELATFFKNVLGEQMTVTPQAFSKARRNVRHEAFQYIFERTRKTIFHSRSIRRFRGYRIFAIDGSDMPLPIGQELRDAYPTKNPTTPSSSRARISVLCDALNGYVLDAYFEPERIGEQELAMRHLDAYSSFARPRDLLIFDRGYPSKKLLSRLSKLPGKFLMRATSSFIKAFPDCPLDDYCASFQMDGQTVHARIVRATLSTGKTEILVTNLSQDTMRAEDLLELYHLRWGVETAFRNLKDRLQLVRFSGRSKQTVLQDFYACLVFYNIACALSVRADAEIDKRNKRRSLKYRYVANRSEAFSSLKMILSRMLLRLERIASVSDKLLADLVKAVIPIRPGRTSKRSPAPADHRAVSERKCL